MLYGLGCRPLGKFHQALARVHGGGHLPVKGDFSGKPDVVLPGKRLHLIGLFLVQVGLVDADHQRQAETLQPRREEERVSVTVEAWQGLVADVVEVDDPVGDIEFRPDGELFAFSTALAWSYYGLKCWTYLFGESKGSEISYKVIFCIFVVIGCSASLGPVIDFSDAAIFAMSITNVIGLYMFMGELKVDMKDYQARLASGEIKRYK